MKRGRARIIIGCILIALQLMSVAGNLSSEFQMGFSFANLAVFLYCLSYWIGYLFVGILGIIFLISGIVARNNAKRESRDRYAFLIGMGIPSDVVSTCRYYECHDDPLMSYLDSCIRREAITAEQRDILFNAYKSQ